MSKRWVPTLDWLLILVPITIGTHFLYPLQHTLVFFLAALAIIPLAGLMGKSTETLADHTGEAVGGLLNATFGNAAELIIALAALQKGLHDVVKASITGSIIGNILLVLGAAFLVGGIRHKEQRFNAAGARSQATMLTLAAIALVLPAAYHHLGGREALLHEGGMSREISIILLATYGLGLLFSLRTHKHLFTGHCEKSHPRDHSARSRRALLRPLAVLAVATILTAWISEILVGSIEHAAHALGMTGVFVGVIVVAVIGNAAEHSTAVIAAQKDRMDLSLTIAQGSSIQIALFVAPLIVVLSTFVGPRTMDLVFTIPEVLAVVVSVYIVGQVTSDGESNWLEGVQLLSVYAILALVFYFLPAH